MNMQSYDSNLAAAASQAEAFAKDADVYRTLLESTRAIPWKIDWATMTFAYIGPQIESVLGWAQDSWKSEDELLRLQKELKNLSLTDGLTGIANRRLFDQRLEEQWQRSSRTGKPLSVILLDLDYFKQYNDTYGHIGGDECLKSVASALDSVGKRHDDVVARFGGEEFALLLPNTDAESARILAEDCASAIASLGMPHEGSRVADLVTASIGSVTAICASGDQRMSLFETVDRLLYTVKQNGRARIETATL